MVREFLVAVTLTLFGAVVLAIPINKEEDAKITVVTESNDYKTDEFNWSYELSDGRVVQQSAYKKQLDDGREVLVINGFYIFVGPDGVKYTVSYYADENGYHPTVTVGVQQVTPEGFIDPKVLASLVG